METIKSPTSHRPDGNKTVHSKGSLQPPYGYPTANFKRDPAIDVIIDSRKASVIENAYTRLAQTTSQRIRSSQHTRLNSLKVPPAPTEVNHEAPFPDRNATAQSSKRPPLAPIPQFQNDTYDDGLGIEFDKGRAAEQIHHARSFLFLSSPQRALPQSINQVCKSTRKHANV